MKPGGRLAVFAFRCCDKPQDQKQLWRGKGLTSDSSSWRKTKAGAEAEGTEELCLLPHSACFLTQPGHPQCPCAQKANRGSPPSNPIHTRSARPDLPMCASTYIPYTQLKERESIKSPARRILGVRKFQHTVSLLACESRQQTNLVAYSFRHFLAFGKLWSRDRPPQEDLGSDEARASGLILEYGAAYRLHIFFCGTFSSVITGEQRSDKAM